MIELYFANPGAGKTTYISKLAQKYNKPKFSSYLLHLLSFGKIDIKYKYPNGVYCNVPVYGTKKYTVDDDLGKTHIEKALILIDEGAIVLDNRVPLSKDKKQFLRLHRHYKCDAIIVSQSWEDVNIVVRRLYDGIYLMNHLFGHFSVIRKIVKFTTISEDEQIIDGYRFKRFGMRLFYRKPYYRYFNSYEKPILNKKECDTWIEEPVYNIRQTIKNRFLSVKCKIINIIKYLKSDKNKSYKDIKSILKS